MIPPVSMMVMYINGNMTAKSVGACVLHIIIGSYVIAHRVDVLCMYIGFVMHV